MEITAEMLAMQNKQSHTLPVCSIHIRVYELEDKIPEQVLASKAIEEVQNNTEWPLITLFNHYDNKKLGFKHHENLARQWEEVERNILSIAYCGKVPESAFVTGYPV